MFRWEYSKDNVKTWNEDTTARFDSVKEALDYIPHHAVGEYLQRIVLDFEYIPPAHTGCWRVAL